MCDLRTTCSFSFDRSRAEPNVCESVYYLVCVLRDENTRRGPQERENNGPSLMSGERLLRCVSSRDGACAGKRLGGGEKGVSQREFECMCCRLCERVEVLKRVT